MKVTYLGILSILLMVSSNLKAASPQAVVMAPYKGSFVQTIETRNLLIGWNLDTSTHMPLKATHMYVNSTKFLPPHSEFIALIDSIPFWRYAPRENYFFCTNTLEIWASRAGMRTTNSMEWYDDHSYPTFYGVIRRVTEDSRETGISYPTYRFFNTTDYDYDVPVFFKVNSLTNPAVELGRLPMRRNGVRDFVPSLELASQKSGLDAKVVFYYLHRHEAPNRAKIRVQSAGKEVRP